jgi:hypothetical protein
MRSKPLVDTYSLLVVV